MRLGSSRLETRRRRVDRTIALVVIVALASVALVTLRLRPNCQAILEDLGYVELPLLTRCVLTVPGWLILCVFLMPGVWMLVKGPLIRDARIREWCSLGIGLAFLAWVSLLVYGLFRPMIVFIQRLD